MFAVAEKVSHNTLHRRGWVNGLFTFQKYSVVLKYKECDVVLNGSTIKIKKSGPCVLSCGYGKPEWLAYGSDKPEWLTYGSGKPEWLTYGSGKPEWLTYGSGKSEWLAYNGSALVLSVNITTARKKD